LIFVKKEENKIRPRTSADSCQLIKIGNGAATGAGILGLISVIDILKTWLGG
jgi:hypothetical protein